jgi:hypothetical protein
VVDVDLGGRMSAVQLTLNDCQLRLIEIRPDVDLHVVLATEPLLNGGLGTLEIRDDLY